VKSFHPLSAGILDSEEESSNIPRPDFTQMIPFKPKAQTIPGDHPVPGNIPFKSKIQTISGDHHVPGNIQFKSKIPTISADHHVPGNIQFKSKIQTISADHHVPGNIQFKSKIQTISADHHVPGNISFNLLSAHYLISRLAVAVAQWPGCLIMSCCSSGLAQHLQTLF
jgi:hypothetical protein